ncbi:MAG TPA: hypothetical protein VI541_02385 [Actinomycetota bacterium]|nr:hypothetical protein [Actinomycetota bacterium]
MTVPVPAAGGAVRVPGRQSVMLQPYIMRSTSLPGASNSSATPSSITKVKPPSRNILFDAASPPSPE